jgi:WD40 repeat protein
MSETNAGSNGRIFISYSRKDKAFVQKLHKALAGMGVDAWVDWEGIELASDWMETITHAIQGTDAFVFIISPDSLKSKVCTDELELGIKLNKKLIPVLYREPTKTSKMHEKIAATNWVYLREQDDFEGTIPRLIQSINTDLGWVRQRTRLLQQAVEWDEKSRNNSFLLNGTELEDAEKWMADASGYENRQVVPLQAEYITFSRKMADRRQRALLAGVSLALVVSIVLSIFAWIARNDAKAAQAVAQTSEANAIQNQHAASTAQADAEQNQQIAEQQKKEAEKRTNEAIANRSAAQSQIAQTRPGELDTSTLLAIDSYQRLPTFRAEDLIRTNASKLALPINQMHQDGPIWNIEWTPDYQYFVTGNKHDQAVEGAINEACVWHAADGEKLFCVQHEGDINDALFTPDGKYLVTASEDKTVRFWDAVSGTADESKTLTFDQPANDLDVSNEILAIGRDDAFLTIYYLNKPDLKPATYEMESGVYEVKFSPDNNILAIGMTNGKVKLWQVQRKFFYNGPKHDSNAGYVISTFSPDSNWLVSGGGDSLARLTRRDGTVQYTVPHADWVEDLAFGPDASWYVTVSDDNKVRVLDTATGKERWRVSHTGFAQKVKVSPNGEWIASTGYDNVVRIWDSASGSQMMEIPLDANGIALSFNQDGTRIVAASRNGTISIWDISALSTRVGYIEFTDYVHEARFTPDGEFLVVNSDDSKIRRIPTSALGTVRTGNNGTVLYTAEALTYNMAISPDSNWVVAVEYNSAETGKNRAVLASLDGQTHYLLNHTGRVMGVGFDQESKFAITTGTNGFISFWAVGTGLQNESMKLDNEKQAFSLTVDPVDTLVAAGLQNGTKVWDYQAGTMIAELPQPGAIIAATFSGDGKWLATSSSEGFIYLWNVEQRTFTQTGNAIQLDGQAQVLAFSADDAWLAGGGTSGFTYLWSTSSSEELARIPHTDPVTSVAFSLDGTQLFTVSRKVVRIWDIPSIRLVPRDMLIDFACSHLTSNLDKNDWTTLFGQESYRAICSKLPVPETLGQDQ